MSRKFDGILSIEGQDLTISFKSSPNNKLCIFKGKLESKSKKDFKDIKATVFETKPNAASGHTTFGGTVAPAGIVISLNDGTVSVNAEVVSGVPEYDISGEGDWN